jgi:hypothetical protein
MVKLCVESTPGQRNGGRMNTERTTSKSWSGPARGYYQNTSTTAALSKRALCMRPFMDNDEHNTPHLCRDAICSAQVESERSERRKPKTGVQHPKGWWRKGGSAGGQAGPTLQTYSSSTSHRTHQRTVRLTTPGWHCRWANF